MQRPWLGLLGMGFVLVVSRPAFAMASQCAALSAELSRLDRSIAATDFAGAAQRQRSELSTARAQKHRCELSAAGDCSRFATLVAGMEANLASLERRIGQKDGIASLQARRGALQRRLAAASCHGETPRRAAPVEAFAPVDGLLSWFSLGGASQAAVTAVNKPPPPASEPRPAPAPSAKPPFRPTNARSNTVISASGHYRTLCVRTCDGYFWPVSYQTSSRNFAKDAQTCRSACPGNEVALYVHRNPGGGSDEAVGLDGKPYTALKAAYRFRREFDRACGCQAGVQAARQAIDELKGPDARTHDHVAGDDDPKSPVKISTRPEVSQASDVIGEFGLRGTTQPGTVV